MDRMKKAAEWFYSNIFRDETIRPRAERPQEKLPALLRTARSLENAPNQPWQSREAVFFKQAKLLADYEDDYEFSGGVTRYYPTYQSLTDRELRGYFSWRTKLRRGIVELTSLSFAFLYIYELLNQIGTKDSMDGYRKLKEFEDVYSQMDNSICPYLDRWLTDYVVYYGLDPNLLAETPQVLFDRSITVLENIADQEPAKIIYAVKRLAPKWLSRSKFYAARQADCDTVIVRVLRRVSHHYATRCKRGFVEQYFGSSHQYPVRLFETAVFCDPLKKRSAEFAVDERCIYQCRGGLWTVTKHSCPLKPNGKLDDLLKTIDAVMREEFSYGHPVKYETEVKWLIKLIREECRALLAEQKAAEAKKITIDYSKLARIRSDAAITQEKLRVEEELEEEPEVEAPSFLPEEPAAAENDTPLSPAEYRLLQCLLYGKDWSWVQQEGYLLSVLVDGINEKLYDEFMDTVLDDTPAPVEDYIEDLKEMVHL